MIRINLSPGWAVEGFGGFRIRKQASNTMIRKPIQSVLVRFHDEGVFKHQNETHVVFTFLP